MPEPIKYFAHWLEKIYMNGHEEWCCMTCGRRLLFIGAPPNYEKIVLFQGDKGAVHFGGPDEIRPKDLVIELNDPYDPFAEFINRLDVGRKLDDTGGE